MPIRHFQTSVFCALLCAASLSMCPPLAAQERPAAASPDIDARMFRYPAVSRDRIAFVYAGDIWLVPKAGGTAVRLSSPLGEESFPRFSPDGTKIAYSANYHGNTDEYVVSERGEEPVQRT